MKSVIEKIRKIRINKEIYTKEEVEKILQELLRKDK